ncbi:MAG: MBL fold metallo-hydrolase [Candidatus Kaiserbacteria bacterium]|nr:MBL fold metallo-hydrolase [Candidatus Kaiserbacteria bacterium]
MRRSSYILGAILLVLFIVVAAISLAAWYEDRRGLLTVSFLNIGQGDSIFIDAPSGRQMLIDGGPNGIVLRRLGEVMPWYDHTIDVVLATHPDIDHTNGLADVFSRYKVSYIFLPSVKGVTSDWQSTLAAAKREGAQEIIAERGQVVDLGDGAYSEILFPDRALPDAETNTASAVVHLVYGKTSFMLTGDLPQEVENYLIALDGSALRSDVLKAGHHGSKNSSSALFLGTVAPAYGVYSRGCNNKYGHPNVETVQRFEAFNIPTFDTCKEGTVTFVSDGQTVTRK